MSNEFLDHEVVVDCVRGTQYYGKLVFDGRTEVVIRSMDNAYIKIMKRYIISITRVD
ncbi:MAG: hypothetical protein QXF97_09105 [Candidatus Caldarchaeum sp.]